MREGVVLKALSLFSGIGGLDLAAHAVGIETVGFCEIEPFAVKVLERRFPGVENHGDITRFTNRTLRELGGSPFHRFKCPADYNGTIDVVHGGFPCQDLSVAGKQRGLSGERSGLWYEMLRVISELRPAYVLAENVRGACNLALPAVVSGLEGEGYEVRASVVPASAFGAPHKRERLFVLGVRADVADCACERLQRLWTTREQESEIHAGEIVPVCDSVRDGKLWPTPQQRDYRSGDEPDSIRATRKRELGWSINLNDAVKLWPTPTVGTSGGGKLCGGTGHLKMLRDALGYEEARKLSAGNGGQLNTAWVEILMGFPLGWTDIDCGEPEPWPGWPAMMGERLWPTHTAGNHYRQGHSAPSEGNGHGKTLGGQCHEILDQHHYEPPRTITKCADRAKRLKCLGNAVVPQQAYPFFEAIAIMDMVSSTVRKREEEDGKNGS